MKKLISSLLALDLLATPFLASAQQLKEVPIDNSLIQQQVQEEVLPEKADTTQALLKPIQYDRKDALYDALPLRQTTVPGLSDKEKKKLLKKYPDGIPIDSTAFSMTVEDSLNVFDIIDSAVAYIQATDQELTPEERNFLNYEAYRIRKNIADVVNGYNNMTRDGKLTTEELSNLLQPRYSFQLANNNRLKEALPEDAYNLIVSAQENFNGYINKVNDYTRATIDQALKTSWYKNWKFTVPTGIAAVTATYLLTKGKGGEEKVYNTGDWSNNTW